jgi:dynein heavy chain, axonemal
MYTNVIGTAFEGVARVQDGVALLEVFYTLAKRDAIKRCVEKKTAEIFELFIRQVERTRHEFDENRRNPPLRENEPEFAGAALWARSLGAMVHLSWALLQESKFLVRGREAADAEASYHALMTVLNEFKLNRYQAWVDRVNSMDPGNMLRRLETPLMRRATPMDEQTSLTPIKAGQLICNFDRDLASLFIEVIYWEKFHGEITIPYAAHDICNQREKLRVVREHVMLIVRAYNAILDDLSTEERRLFSDHIRKLDKRINQGLTKLTWASKGVVEFYVKDCLNSSDMHATVAQFKAAKEVR